MTTHRKLDELIAEREQVAEEGAFGAPWYQHLLTCTACQTDVVAAIATDLASATAVAVLDLTRGDSEPQLVPPGQLPTQFAESLGLTDWETVEVPVDTD